MLSDEDKDALRAMREEIEEGIKEARKAHGKAYGKYRDEVEACYRQYQPPQIAAEERN